MSRIHLPMFVLCVLFIVGEVLARKNTSTVTISKYAKVARWGTNKHNSTDSSLSSGSRRFQNNNKPRVSYHYPVGKKSGDVELVPGVGEVLQERFNPIPYFNYEQIPPKSSKPSNAPPAPVYKAPDTSKPPAVDLYTSPYSSYNPPDDQPPKLNPSKDAPVYPPLAPSSDTYSSPPMDDSSEKGGGPYDYKPADEPKPSLGPPLAPPEDNHDNADMMQNDGPPEEPPKDENQVYYPPGDDGQQEEMVLDHPPPGYKPDMAEDDLSPPPNSGDQPRFPQYLYDQHDFDSHDHHHVYQEVMPTTPPAEDERVNKAHYSYYYLGRKLWYIPLYFSVYFIIYVTVLILKSIARHKIEFKHHFERKSRGMEEEYVNELHENVLSGIENVERKYHIAM